MTAGPLEAFVLAYVEAVGGVSEELEPQLHDLVVPAEAAAALEVGAAGVLRVAFDPEALADHPGAELVAFGNPLLDRIFADAQARGRTARIFLSGFNLFPHDLAAQVRRGLTAPEGVDVLPGEGRVLHHETALFTFQVTFVSDEKEQDLIPVAVDLRHGRLVRHLPEVLARAAISEAPPVPYPDAAAIPLAEAYALAREEAVRAIDVAAHARRAELSARLSRETARVRRYFADLRAELADRRARASAKGADRSRVEEQAQALDREEGARLDELARKLALDVHVRLSSRLSVAQPKVIVPLRLATRDGRDGRAEVVWDPATDRVEPLTCPGCRRPTRTVALAAAGAVTCPACAAPAAPAARRRRTG